MNQTVFSFLRDVRGLLHQLDRVDGQRIIMALEIVESEADNVIGKREGGLGVILWSSSGTLIHLHL